MKKTSIPNLVKSLECSIATPQVAPDVLKALAILSDTTVRRSVVDQEDLKLYWESKKRPHFSRWLTILLFTGISKTLPTTERRLTGWYSLAVDPTFLNPGTTNETFQQSGKLDSFRHILKSSASVYESSGSQFSRTRC